MSWLSRKCLSILKGAFSGTQIQESRTIRSGKSVPRLDGLRLAGGSRLGGGHGGQPLVGRTLPLEEGLGSGEKLAETLLLLLLLGRRGPSLRRRAHDADWLCVTDRLQMVDIDGI